MSILHPFSQLMATIVDDYPASVQTTGVLLPGVTVSARYDKPGDSDWFKFHAEAGQHYSFTGIGPGETNVAQRTVDLYDANGKIVVFNTWDFAPDKTGDYFLATTNYQVGDYTMTLNLLADDYSSDNSNPGNLYDGGQAGGAVNFRGDTDRFNMQMTAGQIYTIRYAADDGRSSLALTPADPNGAEPLWSQIRNSDGSSEITIMPAVSGQYSLLLSAYFNTPDGAGYTLTSLGSQADDYAGTTAGATALEVGSSVSGKIQAGPDIDTFKLELQAGITYALSLDSGQQPYYHPTYALLDGSGKTIGEVAPGAASLYTFTPTTSGSYYVNVAGYYQGNEAYTLSASLAVDDVGATAATAGSISVGKTVSGALEAGGGDRDWYGVALNAGTTYWFSLLGAAEGKGTLPSGFSGALLRVLDANGNVLATSDKLDAFNATAAVLPFVPGSSGKYYIEISTRDRTAGTYQLQAQLGVHDDFGNDSAHATRLESGIVTPGTLELPADKDVFKFNTAAGTTYAFKLVTTDHSVIPGFGASLSASDSSGAYLSLRQFSDIDGQPLYVLDPGAGGELNLSVFNNFFSGAAAPRGYRLTALSYGPDDYSADTKTLAALSMNGQLQVRFDSPADHDWIRVHLDAGRTYVFDLQGALSGHGSLNIKDSGAWMSLLDERGLHVSSPRLLDSGEGRLSFIATSSGDYYLDVSARGAQPGSYTVLVSDTTGDVSAPTVAAVTPGAGASGVSLTAGIDISFSETIMPGNLAGIALADASGHAVELSGYNHLAVAAGQHLLLDPLNLMPGTSYTLQLAAGSVLDLAGNKLAAPFSYTFSTLAAAVAGSSGSDYLIGNADGSILNGGDGIDTVSYAGDFFLERPVGGGNFTVRSWITNRSDTLVGIERVLFQSHAVALDIDGTGGQVYRLYQAAFNRTPDSAGLGYWISKMDHGASLSSVAHDFVGSNEFVGAYGSKPSDADFVSLLYHNVLHRDGEAAGVAHWLQVLGAGTSRDNVLIAFSESAEDQAALIGKIGNGFDYTPYG